MRRKISLYIGNQLMDLDEQSFILFNYTMDDLDNPTIVKNSFSKQITLKGTPNNNAVFGGLFRLDRKVSSSQGETGSAFSTNRKVSFAIYNEMNEILESGYVKMDSITRKGADVEYKVTLYGGLGSFLYSLSYDEQGNKKTLADLDYLGTGSETELDFTINADAVNAAWDSLKQESPSGLWSVINFAPAYEGIPQSEFSADKAVVVPAYVGLAPTITEDNTLYTDKNGYVLVNFPEGRDQWAVKDLRSYLQRPVLSMKSFLNAICNPVNNGGYSVDISNLDVTYMNTWKTLPLLPSMKSLRKSSEGGISISLDATPVASGYEIGRFSLNGTIPFGAEINADVNFGMQVEVSDSIGDLSLLTSYYTEQDGKETHRLDVLFVQAVAYGEDGSIVGGSKVLPLYSWQYVTPEQMAEFCRYTPMVAFEEEQFLERKDLKDFELVSGITYRLKNEMSLSLKATDYKYISIIISSYSIEASKQFTRHGIVTSLDSLLSSDGAFPTLYDADGIAYMIDNSVAYETSPSKVSTATTSSIRSNALVGKKDILSTSYTPADCLLSYCKKLGLHILCDNSLKHITILRRNSLYQNEVIDLSQRIDVSKGISIVPFSFSARWYDFNLKDVGGEFAKEYESAHGKAYGIQRVNTGYAFDANSVDLLSGNVFKTAVSSLESNRYMNTITEGGSFRPSVFVDKGNTYTLWSFDGKTIEKSISAPSTSAVVEYFNEIQGYDKEGGQKIQLHDASGKNINGDDVLVFLNGFTTYPYFKLSDDTSAMTALNDGKPCYDLTPGTSQGIDIPSFSRYLYADGKIVRSLDFGIPAELNMPNYSHDQEAAIYARAWRRYMADRYDENTKVMTCRVNLSGLQVGNDLLRKFYFYENSLWVLNKVMNHSMTTWDSTECEFIQVQNKDNYINGQSE